MDFAHRFYPPSCSVLLRLCSVTCFAPSNYTYSIASLWVLSTRILLKSHVASSFWHLYMTQILLDLVVYTLLERIYIVPNSTVICLFSTHLLHLLHMELSHLWQ